MDDKSPPASAIPPCPQCENGLSPTVVTDRDGLIVEVSTAARRILNLSQQGVERRPQRLAFFFDGHRERVYRAQDNATQVSSMPFGAVLRPRERAPRRVYTHVRELPDGFLEWTIHPVP